MQQKYLLKSMVLVGDSEQHLRWDHKNLKTFKPSHVATFDKGSEAIAYLQNEDVDIVLCDASLQDMDGIQFLLHVKRTFRNKAIPVVMVTAENRREKVLDAISAGCAGYILRPYSNQTFERHLHMAFEMDSFNEIDRLQIEEAKELVAMSNFDDAIEAFEEIVSEQDEAQRYFDMGCTFLVQGKYGKAIIAFNRALKINELFAEAYKGLADAYKGKGDIAKFRENLQKAMDIHARFGRFEETKKLFVEAIKCDSDAPNPFNTLGVNLRKQGDYPGALHAYSKALELTPDDENVFYNMAKAYYLAGMKAEAMDTADKACRKNPNFAEGRALYLKVAGREWSGPAETGGTASEKNATMMDDS